MLVQVLNKIAKQVEYEIEKIWGRPSNNIPFENKLYHAIETWSDQLNIHQDITLYTLQGYYQLDELTKLTNYIRQEGITEKKKLEVPERRNVRSSRDILPDADAVIGLYVLPPNE